MPSPDPQQYALRAHRLLFRVGLSLANVFAWIFVFVYCYSISESVERSVTFVAILYALSQLVTVVLTPISASHLRRGVKQSLVWGALCAAAAYVLLGAAFAGYFHDAQYVWAIAMFAILLGAYRALYWVPYQLASASLSLHASDSFAVHEILVALMPLFAALTLISLPIAPLRLLFGAAAFMVVSIVPTLIVRDTHERFSWSYAYSFKQLIRPKHSALVLSSFLDGLQGAALLLVWPIAIFLIAGWSYIALGFVFSITLLLILLLRSVYARARAMISKRNSASVDIVFAMSAWVARAAAGTPLGVVFADSYAYATLPLRGTNADPFIFEQVTDHGSFLDEYTALKEMALAIGRIVMCLVLAPLALLLPIPVTFAAALFIAGIAAGLNVLLARINPVSVY